MNRKEKSNDYPLFLLLFGYDAYYWNFNEIDDQSELKRILIRDMSVLYQPQTLSEFHALNAFISRDTAWFENKQGELEAMLLQELQNNNLDKIPRIYLDKNVHEMIINYLY